MPRNKIVQSGLKNMQRQKAYGSALTEAESKAAKKNLQRKKTFGSTLTKAEIAAYKRARMKRSVGAAMTAREKALVKKMGSK